MEFAVKEEEAHVEEGDTDVNEEDENEEEGVVLVSVEAKVMDK